MGNSTLNSFREFRSASKASDLPPRNYTRTSKTPFKRDRILMHFSEGRLHRIGSRTVRDYTGSEPFGFYELFVALSQTIIFSSIRSFDILQPNKLFVTSLISLFEIVNRGISVSLHHFLSAPVWIRSYPFTRPFFWDQMQTRSLSKVMPFGYG